MVLPRGRPATEPSTLGRMYSRLFFIVGFALVGCTSINSDDAARAVENSSAFRQACAINAERARCFRDGTDNNYPVFVICFDEGTHYTRFATIRVRSGFAVERLEMHGNDDLDWVEDR